MSLRALRRGQAGGHALDAPPSVPISEIRARKWTKQLKTVGHLSIPKWVPDQENPTEALQRGGFKKTKGRKRPTGEIARMTRSVRQHLDAPLELLSEFPSLRSNAAKQAAPLTVAPVIVQASVATSIIQTSTAVAAASAVPGHPAGVQQSVISSSSVTSSEQTHMMRLAPVGDNLSMHMSGSGDPLLPSTVPSDEQLEMALDDLPMLDSDEDLPFDSLTEDQVPPAIPAQQQIRTESVSQGKVHLTPQQQQEQQSEASVASAEVDDSVENTAESTAEGEDDDDDASSSSSSGGDDDDDNGSANSGSPMPSPSPQSSPVLSPSPSP